MLDKAWKGLESCQMFVQIRKMTVKEGHADKVIERFSSEGVIEKQEGLIDVTVLEKSPPRWWRSRRVNPLGVRRPLETMGKAKTTSRPTKQTKASRNLIICLGRMSVCIMSEPLKQAYTKNNKEHLPQGNALLFFLLIRQDKQRFIGLPFRIQHVLRFLMFSFFSSWFSCFSSSPASFRFSYSTSPSIISVTGKETCFGFICMSPFFVVSYWNFGRTLTIPFVSKIAYSASCMEKQFACLKALQLINVQLILFQHIIFQFSFMYDNTRLAFQQLSGAFYFLRNQFDEIN